MKKTLLFLSLVLFCCGCFEKENKAAYSRACFDDGSCVKLEVADSKSELARGLMHRESLGVDEGMLFVFDGQGKYSIWMKNMNFPIDILWLSAEGVIVDVAENVPACEADPCPTYTPRYDSSFVLEVNAGESKKRGGVVGEKIVFE